MTTFKSIALLLGALTLGACEKNGVQELTATRPQARIRFFNFGVNAPSVNFYANTQKMTAINSATGVESTLGVAYGGVGAGGFYSTLTPGDYTLTGKISATVDKDLSISPVTFTLVDGKAYSYYMSGFYNTTTKTSEAFVVEDPYSLSIDFTQTYVRFVNGISNAAPMTLVLRNPTTGVETTVGALVAYKGAGAFVALPGGVYDISTRVAGSTTNVISRSAVSFSAGKIYTVSARGDITVVSTTATNRPVLDNTANQ